uniref:Mannose-6-phosphate isomerase n=1 Tax=Craspedostauros australis TaxID=1486917 RepID=A0A7R9WW28_9STRA|mmetsp:Transcript_22447/g.62647  ORF Transcript_22447/g.62647 Transcript_22447/m.62647 type:complete len:216 (+) Transcript_22447:198-845(+)
MRKWMNQLTIQPTNVSIRCMQYNVDSVRFTTQVRAGLTPKFKDVSNLVGMLTYSMGGPTIEAGTPLSETGRVIRYTPPVPEFEVIMIKVDPGETLEYKNPGVPSIMIILEGAGMIDGDQVRPGKSFYWPKDSPGLTFEVAEHRRGALKVALAHKNCHIDSPTTVNREDFGSSSHNITVPSSPMPYMGMPTSSPAQSSLVDSKGGKFINHGLPMLG